MIPVRITTKRIGELLIERNIITNEQLNLAIQEQERKGGYLGQHLIALGFARELDIVNCLSSQYNFAYLPLKNYAIPAEVLKLIPLKWIMIYALIPIDRVGDVLSVAMADPLNEGVIKMLEELTVCDIKAFISTYTEINEAIEKYFADELKASKAEYRYNIRNLNRIITAGEFIQTRGYSGSERRKHNRLSKELDLCYYFYGKSFQAKTKDISYVSMCFISNSFIPVEAKLACKIYLGDKQASIDVIMTIIRNQAVDILLEKEKLSGQSYETAGVFDFITDTDKEKLVSFLDENNSK